MQLTLIDQGVDLLLKGVAADGLAAIEQLTSFASEHGLARLSIDQGIGPKTIYEPQPATVTLSGTPIAFPVGGFLQATEDGEAALVGCVREAVDGARSIADLFAGLGTFAFAARATYAAEASRDAAAALRRAAPQSPSSTATSIGGRSSRRADALRRGHSRSAPRGCGRAGALARPLDGRAHRLRQLQSRDLRARCEDARRRRLCARLGSAGRPVPLVDPCRARGLLHPWWMRKIAAWVVRPIRHKVARGTTRSGPAPR